MRDLGRGTPPKTQRVEQGRSADVMAKKQGKTRKPAMRSYEKKLKKEQIDALVIYLSTLDGK